MLITSRTNEHIKRMRALQRAKERKETGLHIIQGEKLVTEAAEAGVELVDVFVLEGHALSLKYDACVHQVTESVMEAISDLGSIPTAVAAAATPGTEPPEVYPEGLIVALDRLQDPGNMGTIIRSADAMGAVGILLSPDCVDPYGSKSLRAAMGSTYHVPLWIGDLPAEFAKLKGSGFVLLAGHLKGTEGIPEVGKKCVLVIGNEGAGVSAEVSALCTKVRLPMKGRAESLNASAAAAIFLYELSKKM